MRLTIFMCVFMQTQALPLEEDRGEQGAQASSSKEDTLDSEDGEEAVSSSDEEEFNQWLDEAVDSDDSGEEEESGSDGDERRGGLQVFNSKGEVIEWRDDDLNFVPQGLQGVDESRGEQKGRGGKAKEGGEEQEELRANLLEHLMGLIKGGSVSDEDVVELEDLELDSDDSEDDDTGDEWKSIDGKEPEVEVTVTVEGGGDQNQGGGDSSQQPKHPMMPSYNCEVRLVVACEVEKSCVCLRLVYSCDGRSV